MEITFDTLKNAHNVATRGLSFDLVGEFNFETALFWLDSRKDYPEVRISALGLLAERVHSLVFTETETGIRVISFRKANQREVNRYEQNS